MIKRDSEEQIAKGEKSTSEVKKLGRLRGSLTYYRSQKGLKGKDSAERLNSFLSFRVY